MTRIMVPVRYPLSSHSRETLRRAIELADEQDADLTILHINLYQSNHHATRRDLKRAVEAVAGPRKNTRYVVREGFLVEESILDEVAAEDTDIVVLGRKQVGRWRAMVRRLAGDPNIEAYLREKLDCDIITVA